MSPLRSIVVATAAALAAATLPAHAQTTINLTAVDGYPPKSLWIKEFIDFYIPEVDKRLAKDNKFKIRWNQAWGGQIVKPNGVLEGIQKGLGDIGIVTTAIYGDKMNILAVAYATPFVTSDPALVSRTIDEMADKFPAIKKTFASYNQVYLTNSVVLDTYQVFSKPVVKGLADMKGLKIAGAGFNLRYLAPVGAVGVSGPLTGYYNQIQTGVVDACHAVARGRRHLQDRRSRAEHAQRRHRRGQHQGADGQCRHLGQAAARGEEGAAGRGHRVPRPAGQDRRRRRRSQHRRLQEGRRRGARPGQGRAHASGPRTCPTWPRNGPPAWTRSGVAGHARCSPTT